MSLRDYQIAPVEFIADGGLSKILLADCGSGKTYMTLAAIKKLLLYKVLRVLIVAPLRVVRLTWPVEIDKWLPEADYILLHGPKKGKRLLRETLIHLINYEGLTWLSKQKYIPTYDMVVFDELTKMKSSYPRYRAIKKIIKDHTIRLGMTGTPVAERVEDLFGQVRAVDDGNRLGSAKTHFLFRWFFPIDRNQYRWKPKKGAKEEILTRVSDITCTVDLKDHVDIIDPVFTDISIELDTEARGVYEELEKTFFVAIENKDIEAMTKVTLLNKLHQVCSGQVYNTEKEVVFVHSQKIDALEQIIDNHKGEQFLIGHSFIHEREAIFKLLERRGLKSKTATLNSKMSSAQEKQVIDRWNRKDILFLVLHPKSGGHGLNLQYGGNLAVWYSYTWEYELYHQFNRRIDRIGQKIRPEFFRLIVKDSMDEVIAATLKSKQSGHKDVLERLKLLRRNN